MLRVGLDRQQAGHDTCKRRDHDVSVAHSERLWTLIRPFWKCENGWIEAECLELCGSHE